MQYSKRRALLALRAAAFLTAPLTGLAQTAARNSEAHE